MHGSCLKRVEKEKTETAEVAEEAETAHLQVKCQSSKDGHAAEAVKVQMAMPEGSCCGVVA